MKKDPYFVQYHVVGMIYLEQGRELSGTDFARLWSSTRVLGNHKATAGFWNENTACPKEHRMPLGSLDHLQQFLECGEQPVFGGGTSAGVSPARGSPPDCDFYYVHGRASRSFGFDTLPYILYAVSGQWFEKAGTGVVLGSLKEHFEVADKYAPPYGLIDVSAGDDGYGGMAYVPFFFLNCHLHRWIEHDRWVRVSSTRRDKARGLYWGNYFGAAILDRLGGREDFLVRFRQQASIDTANPTALVWEFRNGVFVSLSVDPLKCKPGQALDVSAWNNARWLLNELGQHDVLCS